MYWNWHLEQGKYVGLFCQLLGLFMFFALWWHGDRAWRILRFLLIGYFVAIGVVRFLRWFVFGTTAENIIPELEAFIIRSGIVGMILCAGMIVFLLIDWRRDLIRFDHFGPETWKKNQPRKIQIAGLIAAIIGLWWPFAPLPVRWWLVHFTFGFPTGFGVTLTPSLIFLAGLIIAGSRKPKRFLTWLIAISIILSALLIDPPYLIGFLAIIIAIFYILIPER